jgi:hypothetical protein
MKILGFIWALVGLAAIAGWVMNIIKIIDSGFVLAQWGGLQVARVIGVFIPPLGMILGWC